MERSSKVRWRRIKEAPNYMVSSLGDIKSLPMKGNFWRGKLLRTKIDKGGYKRIWLYVDGKSKEVLIHRLVAQTFIPNPCDKPQVNHKNGDKTDNRVDNLEWVTASENELHRYRVLGHQSIGRAKSSIPVICVETGIRYTSTREAERATGISHNQILNVINRKISMKNGYEYKNLTAGGYHWKNGEGKNGLREIEDMERILEEESARK